MRTTRRQLLRAIVGLATICFGLPGRAASALVSLEMVPQETVSLDVARGDALSQRAEDLVGIFSQPSSAILIGRAYLCEHAEEASRERLLALILPNSELTAAASRDRDREHVLGLHRDDLTRARLALVDGWLLSQTEARLYALAALVATQPNVNGSRNAGLRVH